MCGRYALVVVGDGSLQRRFSLEEVLDAPHPHFNVAPTQTMPVIVRNSPNRVEMMRWGLIPSWAKDATIGNRMINARAETVAEKPAYRKPLRSQRCLVPATGFFEWKRDGEGKTPHFIHLVDESLFAFAGLYDRWRDANGETVLSYTILTTEANALTADIHNRMPVILRREDEDDWLDPANTEPEQVLPLLRPYSASEMEAYPVSRMVNSPMHDAPDVLERA
ncbi:MAG: SOS response-associated peptidase [Thermomicrobia bacterium]|nr:SOS response-associated peptidase [Thermomicrobia bacterium]MCA1723233.1 SOS response-associated peptidase [Thermomicrobia bacterium]